MSQVGGRIPALDGLRAISIGLVLLGHSIGTRGSPVPHRLHHFGELGVRVFFVISGYLITTLLLKELTRTGSISLRGFYFRRTLRIFPAFYAYLAVVGLLTLAGIVDLLPGDLEAAVTYTMNYQRPRSWYVGHLWSLAVEEQFYLVWPAIMLLLRQRAVHVASIAVVVAPVVRVGVFVLWPSHRGGIGETFPTIFDALAAGCLLAMLRKQLQSSRTYMAITSTPGAALAAGLVVWAVNVDRVSVDLLIGQSLQNAAIAVIIDWAIERRSVLAAAVLDFAPLGWVGRLSYSLYLWQQLFLNRHSHHWVHAFPLHLVGAFAAAAVSYYLIEQPFLRLREPRPSQSAFPTNTLSSVSRFGMTDSTRAFASRARASTARTASSP
jgi:peptidoglycan/LPS O-acetylase OafA/YrhL